MATSPAPSPAPAATCIPYDKATPAQLALAFPDAQSGVLGSLVAFGSIFALTQVPLAVAEGLLTVLVVRLLVQVSPAELLRLRVLRRSPEEVG